MTSRTPLPNSFRSAFVSALACALVLATGQVASAQGFGTIKGKLVWGGAALPNAPAKVVKGDPNVKDAAVCALEVHPNEDYVVDPKTKGVANGFAYVLSPTATTPPADPKSAADEAKIAAWREACLAAEPALLKSAAEVEIDQKACRFVPHAVAMHKGQTLIFKSSDPVGHNIRYSSFSQGGLNQMLAPNGKLLLPLFGGAEKNPIEVKCDIHNWMNAYFMIFDHPFFAVTKPDGSFEIKGVPAGTQNIIVRHHESGFVTAGARKGIPIEVKAGEVTDLGEIKLVPKVPQVPQK